MTKGKVFEADANFVGFPGRASYGTKGRPIVLRTNYLNLQFTYDATKELMGKTLYRHEVEIHPRQPKMKTRRVMEQIIATDHFRGKDRATATDYSTIIVTTAAPKSEHSSIGKVWQEMENFVIPPVGSNDAPGALDPNAPPNVQAARTRITVSYRITYRGSFSAKHLLDYLTSSSAGATYAGHGDLIQMLNMIICKAPNETSAVANLPGNRFYPHHGALGASNHPRMDLSDLGQGLVALRGYFASVRPATGRILLNLNVTSGAFYPPVHLLELLEMSGIQGNVAVEMFIGKLKVNYEHGGSKPIQKQKTIFGFARTPTNFLPKETRFTVERFGNAKQVSFKYAGSNGAKPKETTVFGYFKNELGLTLQHPGLPVLNVGSLKDPIYIPMEMCTVLPGQPYRKLLSGDQTTRMLAFAARAPNQNAMSITGDSERIGTGLQLFQLADAGGNPQAQSTEPFGFRVATDMLTVPGRILQAPQIQYAKKTAKANNGSWNCAEQVFVKGGSFIGWGACVLNVRGRHTLRQNPQGDMLPRDELIDTLKSYLKNYGLQMGNWGSTAERTLEPLNLGNRAKNTATLDELFFAASKRPINMLFIIIPEPDKWLYAKIKFLADTKYGIHTICSVGSKLQKPNGQGMYMGNLALKFNIKGGGINHTVANTLVNPLDSSTMLMGIDVTHPSPSSAKGAPSIACVVASKDRHLCQWPGSIRKQKGKQEMVDSDERKEGDTVKSLEAMIIERLECWQNNNQNQLPKKILAYRDGVSEGQYQLVLTKELPHFYNAFMKKYGAPKNHPKLAIIIVGKRHHTRFYPTTEKDADYNPQRQKGSWNPQPGTVVDRGITGKIIHEFYLQAHQGLQGTARPAHYVVIKDDIGFNADSLEQITHHLCYMFGRATKAVSIVPPAYYADILAERARAYMYNTLQEAHNRDDSTTTSAGADEWDGEIHPNLKDSVFYI